MVKAQPGVAVGEYTYCAVSGAVFQVSAESARFEQGVTTYYFCCAACSEYFEKNRDAVLQKRGFKGA